jgi:hypothetical protein
LLNFQSAQNATKMVPLRLSRLPDSGGIFTFSNGVRMEKISRSVRRAKHGIFFYADCTCPYRLHESHVAVDVAGDMEIFDWLTLEKYYGDTWHDLGEY